MSKKTIWDDDDTVSEYEMIAEDMENAEIVAEEIADSIVDEMEAEEPEIIEASEEQLEEIIEEAAYELDHKESNVIYNARLRLEQAKLYEMLINHSLFSGVEASPDAVKIVENELKHYIVKRLEVLLGIRKPKLREVQMETSIELPFNETEINFLKQLAYKGTFGKSATDTPMTVSPKPTINPLSGSTKTTTIPVQRNNPTPATKPTPQDVVKNVVKKAAAKKTTKPVAKPTEKAVPKKNSVEKPKVSSGGSLGERKLTQSEIEALAKADLEAMKDRKPLKKMKAKEKLEHMKEVNERHKRKISNGGQPFMDAKQLEMQYLTREANGRSPEDVMNSMVKSIMQSSRKIK